MPRSNRTLQTYYFARDDRVFKAFCDRLREHEGELPKLSRRLRWQIRVLKVALEDKATTFRVSIPLPCSSASLAR